MKNYLKIGLVVLISTCTHAQDFAITDPKLPYHAQITGVSCEADHCEGPAHIRLIDRNTGSTVQEFDSDDLSMFLYDQKPTANVIELYGEQSPLIFEDFNFDGQMDLAIRNGNNSGYSGPSYDVYVQTPKRFVPSAALTELALNSLGLFHVDRSRKRLISYQKSGCCWHLRTDYAVVPKRGLVEMASLEEAITPDGEFVEVTTRLRKPDTPTGRMKTLRKRYPIKDYYGEQ